MKYKKRILVVDDNPAIHNDFKKVLESDNESSLNENSSMLLADLVKSHENKNDLPSFIIDSAYQGEEALTMVKKATVENNPYALAFVDIRMPPGLDGIETIKLLWEIDSDIQIVVCTAYSDYSWKEMSLKLNQLSDFLILKKPFDAIEIYQLASALTKKWELNKRVFEQIDKLESAVCERTTELQHAKEAAEMANQLKSEFLTNISHELLTPLTSIIGFSEMLQHKDIDSDTISSYSQHILNSANHLSQMINNILDISQIDSGIIEFHPKNIDLSTIVVDVQNCFNNEIKNKNLTFLSAIDEKVTSIYFDQHRLKQLLYNLIDNAVKFTKENGKIEVNISPNHKNELCIAVSDTGIGIRKEDIDKIFAAYRQLDTGSAKRYPGIGIGLTLVQHFVHSQGGHIDVKSTVGKGSTFTITLPLRQP